MVNNHDNAVELLGAVQLAVMNATNANARAVRTKLGAALRSACAGASETITRLSDAALAESEFLRDMAWTAETVDPAVFQPERERFAAAMDRLIYEVGVTRIRPSIQTGEGPEPNMRVQSSERFALVKIRLAATLAEWARKTRGVANWSTPSKPTRGVLPLPRPNARRQDTAGKG